MTTFELGEVIFLELGNVIVPVSDVRYIQRGTSDGVTQRFQVALKGYTDSDTIFVEGIATKDDFALKEE